MPGAFGEKRLAGEPELGGAVRKLRPAPSSRAVLRRGIDQENGVAANRLRL
jgi:hypothetical protein